MPHYGLKCLFRAGEKFQLVGQPEGFFHGNEKWTLSSDRRSHELPWSRQCRHGFSGESEALIQVKMNKKCTGSGLCASLDWLPSLAGKNRITWIIVCCSEIKWGISLGDCVFFWNPSEDNMFMKSWVFNITNEDKWYVKLYTTLKK